MNKLLIMFLIFLGINFSLANNLYKDKNSTNNKQTTKIKKKKKVLLVVINKKLTDKTSNMNGKIVKYFNTKKEAIKEKNKIIKNIHYVYSNISLFITFIFMIFQTHKIYKLQEEKYKLLNNNSQSKKEEMYNIEKQIKFEVIFGLMIVFLINFVYYVLELKNINNLIFIIKAN